MSQLHDQSWQERIDYFMANQQPVAAHHLASEITKAEPANPQAWGIRGQLSMQLGNLSEAEYELAEASRLDPADPEHLIALAEVYAVRENYEASLMFADKALAVDPSNVAAFFAKAQVYISSEQPDAAVRILEPLLAKHPDDLDLSGLLAAAIRDAAIQRLPSLPDGTHIWAAQSHIDGLNTAATLISRLRGPVAAQLASELREFANEGSATKWDTAAPQFYIAYGIGFSTLPCLCTYSVFESFGSAVVFGLLVSLGAAAVLFVMWRRVPAWRIAKRGFSGGNFSQKVMRVSIRVMSIFVR